MSRPVVLFNCARNFAGIESIARDMSRLVERCEVRLTDARDGPALAAELAQADVLIARRDYVGRESNAIEATGVLLKLLDAPIYFHRRGKGRFQPAPAAATEARAAVTERLAPRVGARVLDDVRLLVTELITNALRLRTARIG